MSWFWKSDDDDWKEYDVAVNERLETAHKVCDWICWHSFISIVLL